MSTNNRQPEKPDAAFQEEVDAFLGTLPEDSPRVRRIWRKLPTSFHQVLAEKERELDQQSQPAFQLNWSLLAAPIAIAAALVGMVIVVWLSSPELEDKNKSTVAPAAITEEGAEIVITIAPEEGSDEAPQRERQPASSGAPVVVKQAVVPPAAVDDQPLIVVEQVPEREVEGEKLPWSFTPPVAVEIPQVIDNADADWPRTDIDRFVLAELDKHGLKPVGDASPEALLRRLCYDLTGLPPSPELVARFLQNPSPAAYGSVVDELMARWQFGEHWARHWLDVAGYDAGVPNAWRYREYVIAAFNRDKPFNCFLAEQLAGDLLRVANGDQRAEAQIATGFLAMGPYDPNEGDFEKFAMDQADKQVDLVTKAFMGLSVSCARCHDHKFDPIAQSDFFALAGIFRSTQLFNGFRHKADKVSREDKLIPLKIDGATRTSANLVDEHQRKSELKRLRSLVSSRERQIKRAKGRGDGERAARIEGEAMKLKRRLHQLESLDPKRLKANGFTLAGVIDHREPGDCKLNIRGDVHELGGEVPRGFLSALAEVVPAPEIPEGRSGRVELADWLLDEKHPLTARVFVNRVWHQLFGRGLAASVDDFGVQGEPPSHPELLDHLALKFVADGWSMKDLIRSMVVSRTYQLASTADAANLAADPDNRLLWRRSLRQLTGEEVRDSMVAIAGVMSKDSSTVDVAKRYFAAGEYGAMSTFKDASEFPLSSSFRTIYLPIKDANPGMLALFDCPEPAVRAGMRSRTTSPTQALFLMNNEFVYQASMGASFPLGNKRDRRPLAEKVNQVFLTTLGREPSSDEAQWAARLVLDFDAARDLGVPAAPGEEGLVAAQAKKMVLENLVPSQPSANPETLARVAPWTMLHHALMETAEFRFLR